MIGFSSEEARHCSFDVIYHEIENSSLLCLRELYLSSALELCPINVNCSLQVSSSVCISNIF